MSWQIRRFHVRDESAPERWVEIYRLERSDDGRDDDFPALTINLTGPVTVNLVQEPYRSTASRAVISIQPTPEEEPIVAVQLNVDTTSGSESIALDYDDDHGNPTSAPAGSSVAFTSSDASVVQVGATESTATGFRAPLTVGNVGSYSITATQTGANKADGTPIPDPAPLTGDVVPGPASTNVLSEEASPAAAGGTPTPATGTPAATDPAAGAPVEAGGVVGATGPAPGTGVPGVSAPTGTPPGPPGTAPGTAPDAAPTAGATGQLPLYEYSGSGTVDTTQWPAAGVNSSDGKPLYNFSGDQPGGPATGAGPDWSVYTGSTS